MISPSRHDRCRACLFDHSAASTKDTIGLFYNVSSDLPIPASPESDTTWPSPVFAFEPAPKQQFGFFISFGAARA
jgi:hypothetical protein